MVLRAETQQILVKTGTAQAGQLEASNTTAAQNSIVNGGEVGAPIDTLKTASTVTEVELKTKRTAGQVSQALDKISKQTGLNVNKLLEIIERMTGKSLSDLQNVEQRELTNITNGLGKILNDCKVDGAIDSAKLEQAIKDYNIAIQTEWTLDGFYDWQKGHKKQSLSDRLVDTNCLSALLDPNDPDYEAKMEAAIEKFFEKTLLSKINKNTPQAEREQIYKAQLQTYGRLLINTTDGRDKELLGSAIDKLYRKNIVPAASAGLQAMETEQAKANFARHIDLKEAVTTASECEEDVHMTKEEAQKLANLKYGHMNAKDIEADLPVMKQEAEEFFEKYKDILAIIDNKKDGELTPEERAIKRVRDNLHIGRYAGATTGIATSKNSTVVPVKEELLTTVNSDAYEIGEKAGNDFYREVLTQVVTYANSLPEEERANFEALMVKTIGENYTTIVNDIKYGTTTELTAPAPKAESPVQTPAKEVTTPTNEKTTLGYNVSENPVDFVRAHTLTAQLYESQEQVQETKTSAQKDDEVVLTSASTMDDYYRVYNGAKGFKEIKNEFGTLAAIKYTFNKQAENASAMLSAVSTFKGLDCSQQFNTIKGLYSSGLTVALGYAKESTMKRLQDVTLRTFGATKEARKAAEERLS